MKLEQQIALFGDEDAERVAKDLIGNGKATLVSVGYKDSADQWPTAVYEGTKYQLAAVAARANGKVIGRPRTRLPKEEEESEQWVVDMLQYSCGLTQREAEVRIKGYFEHYGLGEWPPGRD